MYNAGEFSVPFPFQPYPLQLHAMEAIRSGLTSGEVVVLESPTGTGKTQVLLNGVLSHVFEPVTEEPLSGPSPHPNQKQTSPYEGTGERKRQRHPRKHQGGVKRNRWKKSTSDVTDPFLVDQDTAEEALERRRLAMMTTISSSSSSRSSRASSSALSGGEEEEEETPPHTQLRKPKVYFASRTHTQLQQMTEELRRTVFVQHPIRYRRHMKTDIHVPTDVEVTKLNKTIITSTPHSSEAGNALPEVPRVLRYVHVAGRQQLCLNASIRAASGGSGERLNELCLEAMAYENSKEGRSARRAQSGQHGALNDIEDDPVRNKSPGCAYCTRERLKLMRDYAAIGPRSLTEMRELGRRVGGCPFLATREQLREADVVLIPYGYLVSAEMRHALLAGVATNQHATTEEVEEEMMTPNHSASQKSTFARHGKRPTPCPPDFTGDVIVVDEAHNLVDSCRGITAASVRVADMEIMRRLLHGYLSRYEMRLLTRNKQRIRELVVFLDKILAYLKHKQEEKGVESVEVCEFSSFVFDADVDTVNVLRFNAFLEESRLLPKLHGLITHLAAQEGENNLPSDSSLTSLLMPSPQPQTRDARPRPQEQEQEHQQMRGALTAALHRFDNFLRWYSRSDRYTRVTLRRSANDGNDLTLDLLQLEPRTYTLSPVVQQSAAMVLAGGTMKPLALTCDLLLRYPASDTLHTDTSADHETPNPKRVRLVEEGHIVPPSSISVFALGVGPSRTRLELQHATRGQWSQQFTEIAAVLLNLSRVVPAGMIVFFTSYEMEGLFLAALERSGMWDAINEVKPIFCEPAGHSGGSHTAASPSAVDAMLEKYTHCVQQRGGALLLAVMGGKLSEGINFSDDLGRAVVVVGLPYANPSDVELQLHLRHIVHTRMKSKATTTATVRREGPFDSPEQWGLFTDLCMRSVNQSIGRCIRHAGDYAAVVLLDARYTERDDVRRRVAAWMQPSVRVAKNFGDCFRGIREFFAGRKAQTEG